MSSETFNFENPRLVTKKVLAKQQYEGDGTMVWRSIGGSELRNLDPFLLLGHAEVSPPGGFPDHPHRGFETVTYVLEGAMQHQDFAGHKGTIPAGGAQWMTAGKGIIHREMPAGPGVHKSLQLWVNLAAKEKMIEPGYQELSRDQLPTAERDGVHVRVVAGESMGVKSPVFTRTPTIYLDFTLQPEAQVHQKLPQYWNAFVYIIEGEGVFGTAEASPTAAHHVLVLGSGEGLSAWNFSSNPLRFILLAGQLLNEPIVQQGSFVMNTHAQIEQAIEDYRCCKNGFEPARTWRST